MDSEKNVTQQGGHTGIVVQNSFAFLDILRVVGAWLVVYDHIFSVWPSRSGISLSFVNSIRSGINEPLGLIQDFGWLGVCIFFLISGFVIAHVSHRETWRNFLIKRFFRIYPLLAVAAVVSIVCFHRTDQSLGVQNILSNLLLVNYWISPQIIYVGVAWTLIIEISFYILVALLIPIQMPGLYKAAGMLFFCVVVLWQSRNWGDNFFLFAATIAFIPYLLTGYVLYLGLVRKELSFPVVGFSLACIYMTILYGLKTIHTDFLPLSNSYLTSYIFAILVFVMFFTFNHAQHTGKFLRFLADTSYSVYLFHGIIGFYILERLVPVVGFGLAAVTAIIFSLAFVTVIHFLIEKPALNFGKRLAKKF